MEQPDMIPVGVGVVFLSYTVGIWGYCLVRGYNVKFTQLFGTTWPGSKTPAQLFPGLAAGAASAAQQVGLRAQGGIAPTPSGQLPVTRQITGAGSL